MDAWIISGLLGVFLGFISAIVFRVIKDKKGISTAKDKANVIISAASQKAENIKKEKILEAKERVLQLKSDFKQQLDERKQKVKNKENQVRKDRDSVTKKLLNFVRILTLP